MEQVKEELIEHDYALVKSIQEFLA